MVSITVVVIRILISSGLILMTGHQVAGDAILDIRLLSFENPENRLWNGQCCHGQVTPQTCRSLCNTFLRICLMEANNTEIDDGDNYAEVCKYGLKVTDPIFGSKHQEAKSTIALWVVAPWTGEFTMVIEAWHKTTQHENVTFIDGKPGFLISRAISQKSLKITDGWKKESDSSNGTVTEYVMHVSCQTAFYGDNCTKMCLDRNNDFGHYICTSDGKKQCRNGWTGKSCTQPLCRDGCHPENGYCSRPGECHCRLGWSGPHCTECVALPGCVNGGCKNSSFECVCEDGWDGLFCSDPICKNGCHGTRGYCLKPDECRCRIGWTGQLCEKCKPLPGCSHGTCKKPFECICDKGWKGLFCESAICASGCHPQNGYCRKPGECRCHVGWTGDNCDECVAYPGCIHGNCTKPWECNCQPGWGGLHCDEELNYCDKNSPCLNGGACVSRTEDDGYYICQCEDGFTGRNCETKI